MRLHNYWWLLIWPLLFGALSFVVNMQREELVAQRDKLPSEFALKYRDYATAEILFPRMDTQIYSEAYPLMREKNIVGVLGMSPTEYSSGFRQSL